MKSFKKPQEQRDPTRDWLDKIEVSDFTENTRPKDPPKAPPSKPPLAPECCKSRGIYDMNLKYNAKMESEFHKSLAPMRYSGEFASSDHPKSLACLLTCTKWVLDVEECEISDEPYHQVPGQRLASQMMDPLTTKKLITLREPLISFKHCELGNRD